MWYIVKYNKKIVSSLKINHNNRYAGIGGDTWPLFEFDFAFHNCAMYMREQIDSVPGYPKFVWTDRAIAEEYYNYSLTFKDKYISINLEDSGYLLGVEYADSDHTRCHGYDFGNADGGSSIIELEIMGCENAQRANNLKDKFLNDFYLFRTYELMEEYLDTERTPMMKEDDEFYDELAITILRLPHQFME